MADLLELPASPTPARETNAQKADQGDMGSSLAQPVRRHEGSRGRPTEEDRGHDRMLNTYMQMQNRPAGIKPVPMPWWAMFRFCHNPQGT
jgi:hypothetical protein